MNVLVIKGAMTADELQRYGLPMAKRFAAAELVIGIDRDGNTRAIKSRERTEISFTDGESAYGDIADVAGNIKRAYEQQADSKDVHLAHAIVGLWLFYWINSDGKKISPLPIEMVAMGDMPGLRASADSFIEADFGRRLPAASRMPDDGISHAEATGSPSPRS